jgi:hypothetical protein
VPLHAGPAFRAQRNLVDSETGGEACDGKIVAASATSVTGTIAASSPAAIDRLGIRSALR